MRTTRTVAYLALLLSGRAPIIGAGGVLDAQQGRVMLQNGALLLQIYTGFIYRGPKLIKELSKLH